MNKRMISELHSREKRIKRWLRKWKLELIEETNPDWKDLFYKIGGSDEMLHPDFKIGDYDEV